MGVGLWGNLEWVWDFGEALNGCAECGVKSSNLYTFYGEWRRFSSTSTDAKRVCVLVLWAARIVMHFEDSNEQARVSNHILWRMAKG
jgi:hypothetical protein